MITNTAVAANTIAPESISTESRRIQPSNDISRRVWALHRSLLHISLRRISNSLPRVNCTAQEVDLVMSHQTCPACMISSIKKKSTPTGSGLRPTLIGSQWSEDYQGPYSTPAIGGYTGKITFVEVTTGFIMNFLVKSKSATEIANCVKKVAAFCRLHGHLMTSLRCDSATTEVSTELRTLCADMNGPGQQGIDIRPAAPEQQNQNPVERHIQSIDNQVHAVLIDQDLLSASWWGYANIAVSVTRNMVSNELCPDSTPLYLMTRTVTNLSKSQFYLLGNWWYQLP